MQDHATLDTEYVVPTYARLDLEIDRGSGCRVWDFEGREYLDFGAGIAVCSLGHAHPEVTEAVSRQAARLVHASNLFRTRPQLDLARKLVERVGVPGKVFFCNSGAEANEGLIKLTRKFGSATGRYGMITFNGSFHGRTMAGISATGQEKVKGGFGPLLEGFQHVPYGDLDAVREAIGPQTASILVEPIQGESGIHVASAAFLEGLRALCNEHDLLLLFDEVQCGLGRTGEWGGWKSISSVQPDGISWAKGIANGFPLGAFWVSSRAHQKQGPLCDLLGAGTHGTTFGGNPVCCAAALKVIEIIERDGLLAHAIEQGERLRAALRALGSPRISEVRGLGLMIGIDIEIPESGASAASMVNALIRRGLVTIPAGQSVIRLLPPLNVDPDEIDAALEILGDFLR